LRGPTARFRRRIAGRSQLMDSASHFPSACASNITLSAAVARLRQRTRRRRLAGAIALVVRTTKVATRLRVGGERNERKESDAPDTGIRVYCSAADATTAMTSWLARAVCRRRRARGRARPPAGGGAVAAGGSPFVAAAHAAAPAPATRIVIESIVYPYGNCFVTNIRWGPLRAGLRRNSRTETQRRGAPFPSILTLKLCLG
jgi:hypothetical protein